MSSERGDALFEPDGATVRPLEAATGPWDPSIVHGAAVNALLAGAMADDDRVLARLTIDFLTPVPMTALHLAVTEPTGGRRIQRRRAVLTADGREVAAAEGVLIRRTELDLPERALDHDSPFDPAVAPELAEPHRGAAETVGRESFDSLGLLWEPMRVEGDRRVHAWVGLALPVVAGTEVRGVEVAAVAADYGQSAVHRNLPFAEWSFRNGEQTLHLAREPVGRWVGIRAEAVVQPVGAGFNTADLFDAEGRVGRSSATVVVEHR